MNRLKKEEVIILFARTETVAYYVVRGINLVTSIQTAMTAYYSVFESHLKYGIIVWRGTTVTNFQKVLVVHKRAIQALIY